MKYLKILIAFFTIILVMSCNNQGMANKELKTEIDSVSYALGLSMASQTKANFEEIDETIYVQGFRNGLDSTNLLITESDARNVINNFFRKRQLEKQKKLQEDAIKKAEEEFGEVKKEGEAFLEKNKTKDGVQTMESGLQYEIIKEGTGVKPKSTDKVKVHYHGTLIDGTVFDSSVDKGTPYETYVNRGVIQGWIEAFKVMDVGSKYKIFVPQELAYGAFPHRGGKVRPFDVLIFEVELLEIVK